MSLINIKQSHTSITMTMTTGKNKLAEEIITEIQGLTCGQLYWINRVLHIFNGQYNFEIITSDIIDNVILLNFGDALRVHHSFSVEPFSKDKFEYVLEQCLKMGGQSAFLATKGNRGHDITINGQTFSLKTQADKNIREDKICKRLIKHLHTHLQHL
ncbi:MAG: hypothetical protein PHI97_04050 [Desulfobulbus sp.]|nr:hypothetical protein [Desulfobulbus sp.]